MTSPTQFPPGYMEEYTGDRVLAATTIILVLSTVLLGLRLYARSLTRAARGWDDFLLLPAWILLLGLIMCLYIMVLHAGLGRHVQAVAEDPNQLVLSLKLLYVLDWFYVPSNALSRASIVLLYLRIFTGKFARICCWVVIAFLIANCVSTIIAAQLECVPLAFTWDKTIKDGRCFDQLLWYKLTNIPNVVADVAIMLLPIRTVWFLKASWVRKLGIAFVCLTGSIGLIASCVRTSVFYNDQITILIDFTFAESPFSWTVVECGMYFSAACLIGLRPLFSCLPRWIKDRVTHESYTSGTYLQTKNSTISGRGGTPVKYLHGSGIKISSPSAKVHDSHNISQPSPPLLVAGDDHYVSNHDIGDDYSGSHEDLKSAGGGSKRFLHNDSPRRSPALRAGEENRKQDIRIETRINVDSMRKVEGSDMYDFHHPPPPA